MKHNSTYLNFQEVCDLLKITPHHLRSLIFKGQIPTTRVGRLLRWEINQLELWLKKNSKEVEGV